MRTPADPDRPISGRARVREQAPRERTYRGGTEAERLGQRLAPGHGRESALDGVIQAAQVVGNAGQGHGRPSYDPLRTRKFPPKGPKSCKNTLFHSALCDRCTGRWFSLVIRIQQHRSFGFFRDQKWLF